MASGPSEFPTTRWTLVIAAADPGSRESRSALAELCERYWNPLYAYLRHRGFPQDEAQDLVQEFFVRVLEGRYLDRANRDKGRFRSFLLTSLKFFVADEQDFHQARKRGGGMLVPLACDATEEAFEREPAHGETPDRIFERRWALATMDRVMQRLRMSSFGKGAKITSSS